MKSFAAENEQLRTLTGSARRAEWANIEQAEIRSRYAPIIENLPRLGQALVLLYGGYLAINGQATVGDIAAFNAYVLMLVPPFRQLGFVMMMGQRAAASAGRIYEVLDEQPDIVDHPGAVDLVECLGDVHFDHVKFDYANGTPVLDDFELHLRPGETVALVGRTGSGKSTVARLLGRFYDVTEGAVRIDGHDVRELTLPSLRHHIGMVLDDPFLFSVSIRDNIAYGRPDAAFEDVEAAAAAAGADDFIRALPEGYDTVVGERGLHPLRRAAPADLDRAHTAREPADPRARRRDVGDRRADRTADPRRAEPPDDRADHADHRPPALHHQPRRPRRGRRERARHRAGDPQRAPGDRTPLRGDPRPNGTGRRRPQDAAPIGNGHGDGHDGTAACSTTKSRSTWPSRVTSTKAWASTSRNRSPTTTGPPWKGSTDGLRRRRHVRRRRHGRTHGRRACGKPGERPALRRYSVGVASRGREAARDRARVGNTRPEVLAPGPRDRRHAAQACSVRTGTCSRSRSSS